MRLLKTSPFGPATLDDLFGRKYEWLMRWALHFAQGDQATAEDLVQDTFVRFAVTHPELDDIENAEALLYTYLRHVHLAHLRRVQRYPLQNLSIAEFDSIGVGLRQNPSACALEVQNNLRHILTYLCWRKESAKSACILILRFFYGYFPQEIAQIGLLSRPAVDNGLRASRKDLKRHLSDSQPDKVRVLGQDANPEFVPSSAELATDQFIAELKETLLSWRRGACLPTEELAARYSAQSPKPIECELLAHIVSCRRCLDVVTHSRKISPLAERSFEGAFMDRHRSRPTGARAERDRGLKRSLGIMRNRIQEILEHQPRSLTLAVNGHIIATQDVSYAVCKQEVEIRIGAPIELVEILSEQGLCLLTMLVSSAPPDAPPEIHQQVRLSCGRSVEAWLRFTSMGQCIETSYRDPALLAAVEESAEADHSSVAEDDEGQRDVIAAENRAPQGTKSRRPGLWNKRWRIAVPEMNPTLATALILAAASVFCFLTWWHQPPRITAKTLLARAETWDSAAHKSGSPGVVYQRVTIKTSERTVNRAIYRDVQGIRRPKSQKLAGADAQLKDSLSAAGVSWDEPLSATNYQNWHDQQRVREDVITWDGSHLLKLTTTVPNGPVLQESLTVRDSDFHPVARTIELHYSGTIEIAELNYDVMPWGAMNEDWFEPLMGQAVTDAPNMHTAIHLPHVLSGLELDEAELAARFTLNQLHADTGEQIQLTRGPARIEIKGVVDTNARKQELVSRLALIPNVQASILSVDEIGARPRSSSFGSLQPIQTYSVEAQSSPLEQYLREKKLPLDQLATISQSLLDQSLRIQHAEVHLIELRQRFKEANQLPADQQNRVVALSKNYVNAILAGLDTNKRTLLSIGLDGTGQAPTSLESRPPGEDIDRQARRYQELCQKLITGEAGETTSAVAIAGELGYLDLRIRSGTAQIDASVSTAHN
jgi:DNA-directed RNA polymerase specialized sigma24 family protein